MFHNPRKIEALEPDFHDFPPLELYNLLDDPYETKNLAESEPEMVMLLRHRMQTWVDKRVHETGQPDPILEYAIGTEKKIGSVGQARKMQAETARKAAEKQAAAKKSGGKKLAGKTTSRKTTGKK